MKKLSKLGVLFVSDSQYDVQFLYLLAVCRYSFLSLQILYFFSSLSTVEGLTLQVAIILELDFCLDILAPAVCMFL